MAGMPGFSPSADVAPRFPTSTTPSAPTARLAHIDTLRGLLLVLMAINHTPSTLHVFTDHPLGFVSAAEGFVFLSGLMAGLAYTRLASRGDFAALRTACVRRAATIYRWHVAIYLAVWCGLLGVGAIWGEPPPNTPAVFVSQPFWAVLAGPLLVQQPSLFDILPLYCVLLVATPWLLRTCNDGRYGKLMLASLAIWGGTNLFAPQRPFDNGIVNTGALNLGAWQLLFVAGLAFGHRWAARPAADSQRLPAPPRTSPFFLRAPAAWTIAALALVAGIFFALRHSLIAPSTLGLSNGALATLTNKNNLAPLRLLDAAVVLYLVHLGASRFPHWFSWPPLAWLGRSSLTVFALHIPAAYALNAHPELFTEGAFGSSLGTALMVLSLFGAATIHDRFFAKKSSVKAPPHLGLRARQPRAYRASVRHEPKPPVPADPLHR